jgi:hypothetical protein|tara:strand:- start:1493 stop:1756 length:264 start_codon:yes stop_codon:yes gene_type:complete
MGFVNNTAGYDQKKVRKYGKLYGSIDFEINDNIPKHYFENNEAPVVGKLHIGNKTFDVTYNELDEITRTLRSAKDVVNRKYKMNMMR